MGLLRIERLPETPLDAAAAFHAEWLPEARAATDTDLLLVFPPADHPHRAWRLAVVQELARAAAPRRVNALAADSEPAIAAASDYLARADGVTGQYLVLDDAGAGAVVVFAP
jgi:hypothetical protein